LNLLESSHQLGALRAVELSLFQRLGARAASLEPAACARWAASASLAHVWRASLLEELLPVSVGLPGLAELTVLPESVLVVELNRALPDPGAGPAGPAGGVGGGEAVLGDGCRLVAEITGPLYDLLLAEYALRLGVCTEAADGAVVRSLKRAVADLEVVRAEGAALNGRLTDPEGG
jgi:hypothetical protein